jgi:hypothetical protein
MAPRATVAATLGWTKCLLNFLSQNIYKWGKSGIFNFIAVKEKSCCPES